MDLHAIVDWDSSDGTTIFQRAFLCPSTTYKVLEFCQPMIGLDVCHTKNQKYPVQLFIAFVLHGNMEILILCFALAPMENTKNWSWTFLRILDKSVEGVKNLILPFISDRHKGLKAIVKEVFPSKFHSYCLQHLRGNVKMYQGWQGR